MKFTETHISVFQLLCYIRNLVPLNGSLVLHIYSHLNKLKWCVYVQQTRISKLPFDSDKEKLNF